MEHPNGDPHERPPDPRRLHKELPQEAPQDTTPANSPEFEIPLPPIRREIRENSHHRRPRHRWQIPAPLSFQDAIPKVDSSAMGIGHGGDHVSKPCLSGSLAAAGRGVSCPLTLFQAAILAGEDELLQEASSRVASRQSAAHVRDQFVRIFSVSWTQTNQQGISPGLDHISPKSNMDRLDLPNTFEDDSAPDWGQFHDNDQLVPIVQSGKVVRPCSEGVRWFRFPTPPVIGIILLNPN